jgi:hypothetical protein
MRLNRAKSCTELNRVSGGRPCGMAFKTDKCPSESPHTDSPTPRGCRLPHSGHVAHPRITKLPPALRIHRNLARIAEAYLDANHGYL